MLSRELASRAGTNALDRWLVSICIIIQEVCKSGDKGAADVAWDGIV